MSAPVLFRKRPLKPYLLYDAFLDTLAAGAVSGTYATPPPGIRIVGAPSVRTVVDTYASIELITNGGFETVTSAGPPANFGTWAESPSTGNIEVATGAGEFHGGANAVKITSGTIPNLTFINQPFVVIPNKTYLLSFWSRGDATNAGRYTIYDNTGGTDIVARTGTGNATTTHSLVTVTFTVPSNCVQATVYFLAGAAAGNIAYFDDVSVLPTTGLLSIANRAASFAGGKASPSYGDPSIAESQVARTAGRVLLVNCVLPATNTYARMGLVDTLAHMSAPDAISVFQFAADATIQMRPSATAVTVGTYTATNYQVAFVLRGFGDMKFIKGGTFANWTLLWVGKTGNEASAYPFWGNYSSAVALSNIRIPQALFTIPVIASDSFARADGALGSTDGLGLPEGGGSGLAWTGTGATIATNKAVITPSTTATLANPGLEGTYAGGVAPNWNAVAGATLAEEGTTFHGGTKAQQATTTSTNDGVRPDAVAVTVGAWILASGWVYIVSGTTPSVQMTRGSADLTLDIATTTTTGTWVFLLKVWRGLNNANTYPVFRMAPAPAAAGVFIVDDVTFNVLSLPTLFASLQSSSVNVMADVTLAATTAGTQQGLVARLDSATTPANFIIAYQDGSGNVKVDQCLNSAYSNLLTATSAFAAGKTIRLDLSGVNWRCYSITSAGVAALLGSGTLDVVTGNLCGLFSTYGPGNTFSGFNLLPKGNEGQHSALDQF